MLTTAALKLDFPWGPIDQIHEIGPYTIFEYHPAVYENYRGTGEYAKGTNFHIYIDGKDTCTSTTTLDGALAVAISRRHDGSNSQAAHYFLRMIGAVQ
jgi:hypothetical protein